MSGGGSRLPWLSAAALLAAACAGDGGAPGSADPDADGPHDAAVEPRDAAGDAMEGGAPDAGAASDAAVDAGADAAAPPAPIAGDDYLRFPDMAPGPDGEIELQFETPSDAASFVLTADPLATPRAIELVELVGPDPELGFDADSALLRSNLSPYLPYAVMLPSSPAAPLVPGRYALTLRVAAPFAEVAIDVVFQRRPESAAARPRELSVAVWFVPGLALDAATARQDEAFQAALGQFAEIFGDAGLSVLEFESGDLAAAGAELAVLDGDDELAQLLAALAESPGSASERALHLIVVDRIEGEGKTVRGKTSGLPGPPAHPELQRRGAVVIALSELPSSPRAAGALIAHEAAHYLGLRHTSEFDGLRHDPIADTPECPAARASAQSSDGTPVLSAEDCEEQGGRNLLFYTPAFGFEQRELSAGQTFVLERHPLLR